MPRSLVLLACVVLFGTMLVRGQAPAPPLPPQPGMPAGLWFIEFTNGVRQKCEIHKEGSVSVAEPLRSSPGKAEVKGGVTVIIFTDDRVERRTPVGNRFIVEHWFPSSQYPTGTPVFGIADRLK